MSDYTPVFTPGDAVPFTASATVTGGQLVEVTTAGSVGPAGAASTKVIGVAAHDAAAGARVTVHIGKIVHEATASGTITVGDMLTAAAAGQVVTNATPAVGTQVGVAITAATNGNKVQYVTR